MKNHDFTILFDLDGTLIDSTSAILQGFEYAFNTFNEKIPPHSQITSLIGYPLDIMFANLGVAQELIEAHVVAYKEKYLKIFIEQTVLLDEAYSAVSLAYEFANLGVVTTKTSKFSHILLEKLEIHKFFDVIVGREDTTHLKPHPEPILIALSQINKTNKNAFMVGDTKLDAMSAKDANVKSIGVTCGYADKIELEKYCDFVVKNANDAVKIVKKIKENL